MSPRGARRAATRGAGRAAQGAVAQASEVVDESGGDGPDAARAKRIAPPAENEPLLQAAVDSNLERRTWLLLLLDGVARAGLTPMEGMRLHRLAFLANCLASVYALPAADGKILKYRRGPFYPVLQWDLDRIVAMGLVTVSSLHHISDDAGPWFHAEYAPSDAGITATRHLVRAPALARAHEFLCEITAAYASLPDERREEAAFVDATYADPLVLQGSIIDFAEWQQRNFTRRTADAFARHAPVGVRLSQREKLHLYFRYLDRVMARAAG